MDKLYVDWKKYSEYLTTMATYESRACIVVGLSRGGLLPAVFLSHAWDFPMFSFDPHLLRSSGIPVEPIILPVSPTIVRNIILIDDISDTGKTLHKCTKFFTSRGFECETMSVFINESTTTFKPNFYVEDNKRRWVVFPYERTE